MRFTVHRPASAEVSPCCHRPSGGDVACGVHVGVARPRAAGDAPENRLALAVFRRDMPAVGASLRCVCRWDEFKSPPGLVLEPGHQQPPPLAADLTVEAPFLCHVGARAFPSSARRSGHRANLQVLDADGVEAARQIGGGLFHPVTAAICFAGPQRRNGQLRSRPSIRSASRPGQTPLQSPQPLGFTNPKAGNAQQIPARQRNRDRHPAINTHHAAILGPRDRVRDDSKSEVPPPGPIQCDSVRLHRARRCCGSSETAPNRSSVSIPAHSGGSAV